MSEQTTQQRTSASSTWGGSTTPPLSSSDPGAGPPAVCADFTPGFAEAQAAVAAAEKLLPELEKYPGLIKTAADAAETADDVAGIAQRSETRRGSFGVEWAQATGAALMKIMTVVMTEVRQNNGQLKPETKALVDRNTQAAQKGSAQLPAMDAAIQSAKSRQTALKTKEEMAAKEKAEKGEGGDPKEVASKSKALPAGKPGEDNGSVKGSLLKTSDGKYGAGLGGDSEHVDAEKKRKETSSVNASVVANDKGGQMTVTHGQSTTLGHDEKKLAAEEKRKDEFELKKLRGEIPADAKLEDAKKYEKTVESKTTGTLGYDKDKGLSASGKREWGHKNADGTEKKQSVTVSATGTVDKDGKLQGSLSGGYERKTADGKELKVSGGIEKDKDGVVIKAGGGNEKASGEAELTLKDDEKALKAKIGGGETKTFSLGGGVSVKFTPPAELPGGQFSVTYTVAAEGEVGVGAADKGDPKAHMNTTVSVGGSFGLSGSKSVTRVFASREEAEAWRNVGSVGALPALPQTPAAALSMKPGEAIETGDGTKVGVSGSAGNDALTVSAGFSEASKSRDKVARGEGNKVTLTKSSLVDSNGNLAAGNLVSAGVEGNAWRVRIVAMEVDLGPPDAISPAAQEAFAHFQATGNIKAPGREVYSRIEDGKGTTLKASAGPLTISEKSETSTTVEKDEHGNRTTTEMGRNTRAAALSIPILGQSMEHTTQLNAIEVNGKAKAYEIESTIKGDSAWDNRVGFQNATNVDADKIQHDRQQAGAKATDGTWRVSSKITPEQMQKLYESIEKGGFDPRFGGVKAMVKNDTARDLMKELKQAGGDVEKRHKALAKFVAEGGPDAAQQLRTYAGVGPEFFLSLTDKDGKKSSLFAGASGQVEIDEKVSRWQSRLPSVTSMDDLTVLAAEISGALSLENNKTSLITPERFPDVPPALLEGEVGRARGNLGKMQQVLDQVRAKMGAPIPSDASPEERAKREKAQDLAKKREPLLATVRTMKANAVEWRSVARGQKRHHEVDGLRKTDTRRERGYDDNKYLYDRADQAMGKADAFWLAGTVNENMGIALGDLNEQSLFHLQQAADNFGRARNEWLDADNDLKHVKA